MKRTASFRRTLLAAGILAVFPCVLPAQEHGAEEARSAQAQAQPAGSVLHVGSESLLRVDFPGRKNWEHIKGGTLLEGRLALPLYAGEQIAAPAGSTICVTLNLAVRIREDLGFWRRTGRAMTRAFNPFETAHPTEYRVELSSANLQLPNGEPLPLDVRVLRASSGVIVQPKTKSLQRAGIPQEKNKAAVTLLLALRRETPIPVSTELNLLSVSTAEEQRVARAYLLTALRASVSRQGDTFRAQLAEPVGVAGWVFAPGSIVEGTVVRSIAPRKLSRAGSLRLRVNRIVPTDGEALRVSGSLSAAEADAQTRFALDEEGELHGRKPGILNGLVDLGYAYALGKLSDDLAEAPIRAVGVSLNDAAVATAARYVGLGTSLAFLITRHGRDVYLPRYALLEIYFGRASEPFAAANRD